MSGLVIRGVEGREDRCWLLEETVIVFPVLVCVLGRCQRGINSCTCCCGSGGAAHTATVNDIG